MLSCLTGFFLGSDTTAGTITFLLYYLLADRKVYSKLRAELDAHFNGPDDITDFKALQDLPYLYGVVHEGLRLGTPFPGLPRVIPKGGYALDGVYVPEGTIVVWLSFFQVVRILIAFSLKGIPPYVQQTSPENFYPRPLEFLPERWIPEGLGPDTVTRKSAIMCFSFGEDKRSSSGLVGTINLKFFRSVQLPWKSIRYSRTSSRYCQARSCL